MKWIGHTEFGPNYKPICKENLKFVDDLNINHWLEQWYLTYSNCLKNYKNNENIYFVCYEQLCSSKAYWLDLLQKLNLEKTYDFEFKETLKEITIEVDHRMNIKVLSLYSKITSI